VNHTLTQASGSTHAKIAALAVAASLVFVAVVAASGSSKSDTVLAARTHGPVVKATTLMNVAHTGSTVR